MENAWDKGSREEWEIQFPPTPMSNYHNYCVVGEWRFNVMGGKEGDEPWLWLS